MQAALILRLTRTSQAQIALTLRTLGVDGEIARAFLVSERTTRGQRWRSLHSATTAHPTCTYALRVKVTIQFIGAASGGGRPT